MSFQDELKQNLRTPEAVRREHAEKENAAMLAEAQRTLEEIKRTLINNAKGANYTTHNGVTTISCICSISQRFLRIRHEDNFKQLRQNQQTFFLFRDHNMVAEMWESYDINPTYSSEFHQYMSSLKRLAAEENISVDCVVHGNVGARGLQTHTFPAKVTRTYGALCLAVRASTKVTR